MDKRGIGYFFKIINDKLKVSVDADMKSHGITLSQSRTLTYLKLRKGSATQKELQDFLKVSHPTVVGIVSRLEQNGYVTTYIDRKDSRSKYVVLTDKASAIINDISETIRNNEKKMLQSLSEDDIEQLKKTLTAIYKNLNT